MSIAAERQYNTENLARILGLCSVENAVKITSDVKQRGQKKEQRNNNSCTTKKNITGFYTNQEPNSKTSSSSGILSYLNGTFFAFLYVKFKILRLRKKLHNKKRS